MKYSVLSIGLLATSLFAASVSQAQHDHGDIEFTYEDGLIVIESDGGIPVFEGEFPESGFNERYTDDPGFASEVDEGLGLNPNDIIAYNILDNLYYWDGTSWSDPGLASITIANSGSVADTIVDGTSGYQGGSASDPFANVIGQATTDGDFHSHLEFYLNEDAPVGAYGLVLNLMTDEAGIGESGTFGILFNYGLEEEAFEAGVDSFAGQIAGVPEPGMTLALGVLAAATATFGWRRRRKQVAKETIIA